MGSLTKTFTAAAILRLEMEGKLGTNDSIRKYLGELPRQKAGATIHHLLTHTAGLMVEGASRSDDGTDREKFIQGMKIRRWMLSYSKFHRHSEITKN
jgi:CubicO group peptidase (beta-lactamase class C family)